MASLIPFWTIFSGDDLIIRLYDVCMCAEMGVNMMPGYMIKYGLDQETGSISTDEEQIIIGFSTQEKKGILMYIRNSMDLKHEYISVEVNNNGKLFLF